MSKSYTPLSKLPQFDPRKVPVVMVHGLWSSPLTWMEMFNDLRSDPTLRKNCQFWFYLYPTGQPFWNSAVRFRVDLEVGLMVILMAEFVASRIGHRDSPLSAN